MNKYKTTRDIKSIPYSSYFILEIIDNVLESDNIGDQIGIFKESNSLEFTINLNIEEVDIENFIRNNFAYPNLVMQIIEEAINESI